MHPWADNTAAAPLVVPCCFSLEVNEPRRSVAVVGKCIYCAAVEFEPGSGKALSEEHFVPEGLGSRLVLEEASCRACAERTAAFENAMLQKCLLTARRKMGLRGKRRKRNEPLFAVRLVNTDGTETIEWRTLEEHPTLLFLVAMDAPGLLQGRAVGKPMTFLPWMHTPATIRPKDMRSFSSPVLDTVALCQMIAKIAHGFAVWQFGLDGFTPLLLDLILRGHDGDRSLSRYFLVGGSLKPLAPTKALHVLGWDFFKDGGGKEYLVVAVRLFSYVGAPMFFAVTGQFNSEQAARARAIVEAHAAQSIR